MLICQYNRKNPVKRDCEHSHRFLCLERSQLQLNCKVHFKYKVSSSLNLQVLIFSLVIEWEDGWFCELGIGLKVTSYAFPHLQHVGCHPERRLRFSEMLKAQQVWLKSEGGVSCEDAQKIGPRHFLPEYRIRCWFWKVMPAPLSTAFLNNQMGVKTVM